MLPDGCIDLVLRVHLPGLGLHQTQPGQSLWARLKEWCAVAASYKMTATSFMGVLSLAATMDWLEL